jgi:Polysaccharide deacetylase
MFAASLFVACDATGAAPLPSLDGGAPSDAAVDGASAAPGAGTPGSGASEDAGSSDATVPGAADGAVGAPGDAGPAGDGGARPGPSGLPQPSSSGVARPAGSGPANLHVLPWAGFRAAASFTFDDSQPSQVAHLPDLAAAGAPVTHYLNTVNSWIDGYDAAYRAALARGDELGNHTVHHCAADLSGCSGALASVAQEIDTCSDYITGPLGGPAATSMAYPYGDVGYAPAARQRFPLARGIGDGWVVPGDDTDPFDLPVKAATGGERASVFEGSIDGARGAGAWVIFLFHSLLPGDNWYAGVDIEAVTTSIGHAREVRDVWLDTVSGVGAYWLGARALSAAVPSTEGSGQVYRWQLPEHFPTGRFVRVTVDGGLLRQQGAELPWDEHGYYEVALDARELSWAPR